MGKRPYSQSLSMKPIQIEAFIALPFLHLAWHIRNQVKHKLEISTISVAKLLHRYIYIMLFHAQRFKINPFRLLKVKERKLESLIRSFNPINLTNLDM